MDGYGAGQGADEAVARLHLRRAPGVMYAVLALVLLTFLVLGVRSWLLSGHLVAAFVTTVAGLGVVGYLLLLAVSIIVPELDVSTAGIAGKLTLRGTVDVDWDAVTVDVDDGSPRGRFRVDLGGESVEVDRRTWLGFDAFVLLVASTAAATARLTPAARDEVLRLLGIAPPAVDEEPA